MNSGNYVAAEEPDEPITDNMELSYKVKHSHQCSNCGEFEGKCKCKVPLLFDVWTVTFSDFTLEIYNEFDEIDCDVTHGTIPKCPVSDVDLKLESDLKKEKYNITLCFWNGFLHLDKNNH
jgi:hypothetical protein